MLSATRFIWSATCWRFSTVFGVMVGLRGLSQLPSPTARMSNRRTKVPQFFNDETMLTGTTPIGLVPLNYTANVEQVPVIQRAWIKAAVVPMMQVTAVGDSCGFVEVVLLRA